MHLSAAQVMSSLITPDLIYMSTLSGMWVLLDVTVCTDDSSKKSKYALKTTTSKHTVHVLMVLPHWVCNVQSDIQCALWEFAPWPEYLQQRSLHVRAKRLQQNFLKFKKEQRGIENVNVCTRVNPHPYFFILKVSRNSFNCLFLISWSITN